MIRLGTLSTAVAVLVAVGGCVAYGGPLTNGSFEDTDSPVVTYVALATGSTFLHGWNVYSGDSISVVEVMGTGLWAPADGLQFVQLQNYSGQGASISQTFDTSPGVTYAIRFWLSSNWANGSGSPASVRVTAALADQTYTVFTSSDGSVPWYEEHFSFLADSSTTTVTFAAASGGYGPSIDNVIINAAIPEPSAALLILPGLAALLMYRRQRMRTGARGRLTRQSISDFRLGI